MLILFDSKPIWIEFNDDDGREERFAILYLESILKIVSIFAVFHLISLYVLLEVAMFYSQLWSPRLWCS